MTREELCNRMYQSGWTPCFPITDLVGCRAIPKSKGVVEAFLLPWAEQLHEDMLVTVEILGVVDVVVG